MSQKEDLKVNYTTIKGLPALNYLYTKLRVERMKPLEEQCRRDALSEIITEYAHLLPRVPVRLPPESGKQDPYAYVLMYEFRRIDFNLGRFFFCDKKVYYTDKIDTESVKPAAMDELNYWMVGTSLSKLITRSSETDQKFGILLPWGFYYFEWKEKWSGGKNVSPILECHLVVRAADFYDAQKLLKAKIFDREKVASDFVMHTKTGRTALELCDPTGKPVAEAVYRQPIFFSPLQ